MDVDSLEENAEMTPPSSVEYVHLSTDMDLVDTKPHADQHTMQPTEIQNGYVQNLPEFNLDAVSFSSRSERHVFDIPNVIKPNIWALDSTLPRRSTELRRAVGEQFNQISNKFPFAAAFVQPYQTFEKVAVMQTMT